MSSSTSEIQQAVADALAAHRGERGPLMEILHHVQDQLGCIPPQAVPDIARGMNLSRAEVHGVISFYHDFRSEPKGQTTIQVCRAEACQAMGARELEQHVKQRLGVDYGHTTADGRFTLEPVYCLGNCACSPSLRIGDDVFARVSPARFDEILQAEVAP